jgi:hypothetical protein
MISDRLMKWLVSAGTLVVLMAAVMGPCQTIAAGGFQISKFSRVAPGDCSLEWNFEPGYLYQVRSSDTLGAGSWRNIGPIYEPDAPAGTMSFADTAAATNPRRFYQVARTPLTTGVPAAGTALVCGFEAGEQGMSLLPATLTGQGVPVWSERYLSDYDVGGTVTTNEPYAGNRCLYVTGYSTSRVTLANKTVAPWFEFAFRPDFPDLDPQRTVWARTTRGDHADMVGVNMVLNNMTRKILVNGVEVGDFKNGTWHSISFRHTVAGGVYSGSFDVYLNGQKKVTVNAGSDYNGLKTIVFSSAEESWAHNGAWSIDGVRVGNSSIYTGGTNVLECGFEAGEQPSAFSAGALTWQGSPAWLERYLSAYDAGGTVTSDRSYDGTRSLSLTGYSTSRLSLGAKTAAPWFEFAFRSQFPDADPERVVWAKTTRGGVADIVGVDVVLNNRTRQIVVNGGVVGEFLNNTWQTLSFHHETVNGGYTGRFEVYLDGRKKALVDAGASYDGLQTMVFSSAESSWEHNGAWFIDGIRVGDRPSYVDGGGLRDPERHLLGWASNFQNDYKNKVDYFDKILGLTDIWIHNVQDAFPTTFIQVGFPALISTGVLDDFADRGINYWLGDHEAFCTMVRDVAALRDDTKWNEVYAKAATIYTQARALGFKGLVLDAENYYPVTPETVARYQTNGENISSWSFSDEFGADGDYYRRGLAYGNVIKSTWPECILIQIYEALIYGSNRQGNYWWLQGIHDAGVEIWIGTQLTYGAGANEIAKDYLGRWHVNMSELMTKVQAAYPMASRVLPGFHPWNIRTGQPQYLPKYLTEQMNQARNQPGFWLYTEGLSLGGDPREPDNQDAPYWQSYKVTPQEFFQCFQSDTVAPTGTLKIDDNATSSSNKVVMLSVTATDLNDNGAAGIGVDKMRFSNDGSAWSSWETFASSKSWSLTSGNGVKTVYAQLKDARGNLSTIFSDSINLISQ